MDIVDNQLRDNTPPETRQTLARLVADGHTLEDARRLIGCVVSTEIYDIVTRHRPFVPRPRTWPHSSVCRSCRGTRSPLVPNLYREPCAHSSGQAYPPSGSVPEP